MNPAAEQQWGLALLIAKRDAWLEEHFPKCQSKRCRGRRSVGIETSYGIECGWCGAFR